MKRGKILFSSSFLYLTFPQFKALIPELGEFKHILLNVNEPDNYIVDNKYVIEKNATQIFDYYIKLKPKKKFQFDSFKSHLYYKKILTEYLYKINPDAIISGSDMSLSDRVMFSWCKKKNIPFFVLQPSFIDGFPEKYGLKQISLYVIVNRILNLPVYKKQRYYGNESQKSYLFLWSQYFVKNPKRKNLFVLGNPAFDKLFKHFSNERKLKDTILICTEGFPPHIFGNQIINKVNKIILKAVVSKPEITFYIKAHPREPRKRYTNLFPKNNFPNVEVVRNEDLYELFKLSDVQISVASFTSFEAVAMGLPIIMIRPDNIKVIDHFKKEIEIRATNEREIVDAINLCLSDVYWSEFLEKREKFLKKMLYYTDGQSSKRIANAIKQIILKNESS